MSFARDLSVRLTSHGVFHEDFDRLHLDAAAATMVGAIESDRPRLESNAISRLLYCAGVFAQTGDEQFRALAQLIALNSLLLRREDVARERSLQLLTELGNFPAIAFAEKGEDRTARGLGARLGYAISRELNAVDIAGRSVALTDFQKETWDSLPHEVALAISAPTSAGKSFIVIEHLCREALSQEKFAAVYIAPTRALLSEVQAKILKRLRDAEGVRVSTVPSVGPDPDGRQIFVLTQERLQVLLALSDRPFDLVVVDEAQNISDGSRGMILQECLEQALRRSENTRVLMLAPGVKGFDGLNAVIGQRKLATKESSLPSVVQNRILVTQDSSGRGLQLELITPRGIKGIGRLDSERGFALPSNRLAAVALELGKDGGSLVYATGASDSEDVALKISLDSAVDPSGALDELAEFIETHIHKQYGLANLVRRGVAFHYGKMPTLLREAIENSFKSGDLRYLACTTTLFQGVNLPARNVFIDTPTRGTGAPLDHAALWNFAGRAGRMHSDVVGNVFLIDYHDWPEKPMEEFVGYTIEPAFEKTVQDHPAAVVEALAGQMPRSNPRDEVGPKVRAAAGLLISRAAKGDVEAFLDRTLRVTSPEFRANLVSAATSASAAVGLPASILSTNWTVNPFGLRRLYDSMRAKVDADDWHDLIPLNPHDGPRADQRYVSIFQRLQREVNGVSGAQIDRFHAAVATTAVRWMTGVPYPALLQYQIEREVREIERKRRQYEAELAHNPRTRKRRPSPLNVNRVVRRTFDLIEDIIRFQYVQLGKAYVDVLNYLLLERSIGRGVKVFDFPLALELGLSTRSGWSFMELGLSRIAATALADLFPDTNMTVEAAQTWLDELEIDALQVSAVVREEVARLKSAAQP